MKKEQKEPEHVSLYTFFFLDFVLARFLYDACYHYLNGFFLSFLHFYSLVGPFPTLILLIKGSQYACCRVRSVLHSILDRGGRDEHGEGLL